MERAFSWFTSKAGITPKTTESQMDPIPIKAPDLGVRPDLDPEDVPDNSLVTAENMIKRDGDFRVRPGFTAVGNDINERPMGYIHFKHADGNVRTVMGTTVGWRNLSGGTWGDLAGGVPLTATADDHAVFRTFSKAAVTHVLGVNGKDAPKKWDGAAASYSSIGGSPPIARCIMTVFDRIVLGNLISGGTISPLAIDVSANKDFDTGWGSELVALLADTEGAIMSMEEMGTLNGAILKSDSVFMLIGQGGTTPFRIQWVKSGVSGPASQKMSAKLSTGAIAIAGTDGKVSIFDGSNVEELPYYIQKQIVTTANLDKFNRGWMVFNPIRRELWIVYPLLGSDNPNGGVMINMGTLAVYPLRFSAHNMSAGGLVATTTGLTIGDLTGAIGSLSNTIGSLAATTALRRLVMGDTGGQTFEDIGDTDAGTAIPFFWETPVRGQAERFTTLGRIRHRFKPTASSQPISLQIGKRNAGGAISYGTAHTINATGSGRKASGHRVSAEFLSMKFSGDASDAVVYQGSSLYARQRGRR